MEKVRVEAIRDEAAAILRQPPVIHARGTANVSVMVGELHALAALAALALEALEWRANVSMMLNGDRDVIHSHEGGNPAEDLIGSLCLTMIRTRRTRDNAR